MAAHQSPVQSDVYATLCASEAMFRTLVDGFAQAVWETDPSGTVVADSPSWRAYTGQTLDEWLGCGWLDAVHPDDRASALRAWQDAVAARRRVEAEFRLRRANGGWCWTNVRAMPLFDAGGALWKWVGINIDVDERRRAQAALAESEARYRILFEHIDEGFCIIERVPGRDGHPEDYQCIAANPAAHSVCRIEPGRSLRQIFPDEPASWFAACDRVLRTGQPMRFEHWFSLGARLLDLFAFRYPDSDTRIGLIFRDVTAHQRAEQALRDADRRKDEFLATLAHELRNPLAPISNAVELLRQPHGRRSADRIIEMVGRQVHHIVHLVDDLMDVSRITRGKIELERKPVLLADAVRAAVEISQPAIDQAGLRLEARLADEALWVEGDRVRLTQVVANLLGNAAKFTGRGGRITLDAGRDGEWAVLTVRDTGAGIDPAQLPRVFDMFVQADSGATRSCGGLGIGLTMVRNLVEMHGGRVDAFSAGPDQGSEFTVRLPLHAPPAGAACAEPEPAAAVLAGRRVLIVDDNRDAADSLCLLLSAKGADARVAYDGAAGLAALESFAADVLILDIGMPAMNGHEVARRVRADGRHPGLCIIALTGWGQQADREQSQASGFDHHLTKPVDLEALECLIAG